MVVPWGCDTDVFVSSRRPLNVRVAVDVVVTPETGSVVTVETERFSGGMTETSSTTSPRVVLRVVDTEVKFWPVVSEYWLVHVPSTLADLNVQLPFVVDVTLADVVTMR